MKIKDIMENIIRLFKRASDGTVFAVARIQPDGDRHTLVAEGTVVKSYARRRDAVRGAARLGYSVA